MTYVLTLLSLVLASCFSGPKPFSKEGAAGKTYAIVAQEADGVTEGLYSAGVSTDQVMSSQATGAMVKFPSGSLAIDTRVSIQAGANIASSASMASMGINSGVSSSSQSIVVSSSTPTNAANPFSLQLGLGSTSLALNSDFERLVVIFKIYDADKKEYRIGVILRKDITIVDGKTIQIETRYFGSYQPAFMDTILKTEVKSVAVESGIMTKNELRDLPKIDWTLQAPSFVSQPRAVTFPIRVKGFAPLTMCSPVLMREAQVLNTIKVTDPVLMRRLDNGESVVLRVAIPVGEAFSARVRITCVDKDGRHEESPLSAVLAIPAQGSSSGGTPGSKILKIIGFGDPESSATVRRVDFSASGYVVTVGGECEDGTPIVARLVPAFFSVASIDCVNSNFVLRIGQSSLPAAQRDLAFESVSGSARLELIQGPTVVRTILFNIPNATMMRLIDEMSDVDYSVGVWNVMRQDIDLTGVPYEPSPNQFAGAFDGDGHTIMGLSRSLTGGRTASWGLFSSLHGTARVSHLTIKEPSYSNSAVSGSPHAVGFVAGNASTCGGCKVHSVVIDTPQISFNTGYSASNLGSVIGSGSTSSVIHFSDVRVDAASITAIKGYAIGGIMGVGAINAKKVSFSGSITALNMLGGIVGQIHSGGGVGSQLEMVDTSGMITAYNHSPDYNADSGGFVGRSGGSLTISQSRSKMKLVGAASTTNKYYGGFVGHIDSSTASLNVSDSIARNEFDGPIASVVGGVVGKSMANSGNVNLIGVLVDPLFSNSSTTTSCGGVMGYSEKYLGMVRVVVQGIGGSGCTVRNTLLGSIGASAGFLNSNFSDVFVPSSPAALIAGGDYQTFTNIARIATNLRDPAASPLNNGTLFLTTIWRAVPANAGLASYLDLFWLTLPW